MSNAVLEVPAGVAFNVDLRPIDVRVYMALAWFLREDHDRPALAAIAELAGIGPTAAIRARHNLERLGLIEVDRRAQPYLYSIPA